MSDNRSESLIESTNYFDVEGSIISVERFGSGHINDTYCVKTDKVGGKSYLLQRINHHIFVNVDGLMQNTKLVLDHIKGKLAHLGVEHVEKASLTLIPTKTGDLYRQDENGDYWRMFILLEGTKSYDIVESANQAYSAGQAFGEFQMLLSDLNANKLVEILPNFHNIDFRINNLKEVIKRDPVKRVAEVQDILDFVFEREERMRAVLLMAKEGRLPLRITHNDTKFNNVLLDSEDRVQCVIDLDTVMPGYVAYDFGDAIRTIINSAAEDEADLSKVVLNIPFFEGYAKGYMSKAKDFLTDNELSSLLDGVFLLPFMQAVRFLTDYIDGDTYYKIQYPEHNLVRTKSQIKLVQELEAHESELVEILESSVQPV
ncbi:aminoglycoside phosphotransferase family protein [Sphingobacterium sp. UT-1RO-CII-1]|uniref:phosphotransferase enzyme family protein n=1 Tax=Sphingobacterium sp. UT-1RO-CII-1 TaxID=2995225 RepID=UPI00227D0763|nr:aminoglycoside phosphotransferase family protein [Sphingobacterium sp. UT-1RO-CII-1]MCY4779117.1 aminoglycoside phosphotransferase family protein [Sphingobacterium sp. UT-1RO-CII-1]